MPDFRKGQSMNIKKKKQELEPLMTKKKSLRTNLLWLLIMAPGIIYIFINNILPLYGITIAFRDISFTKGPLNSPFWGFESTEHGFFYNFEMLFASDVIGRLIRNTVLYNLVFIILDIIIPVIVAILFYTIESQRSKKFFQTAILLPNIISWVIIGYISYSLFSSESGMLSKLFGITDFYTNPSYWPFILTFFHVWKGVGMGMVVYHATLVGIDPALYEAAKIDGANWLQRTFNITIPHLKRIIITMFIMNLAKIMTSDFSLFYQVSMNSTPLYEATETLDMYVFINLTGGVNIETTAAVSFFQSIIGFILVITANAIIKKVDKESALF